MDLSFSTEDSAVWLRINTKPDVSSTGRVIQYLEIDTAAQQRVAAETGTQQQLHHRICPSPTSLALVFSLPQMMTELKVANEQN